MTEVAFKVLLHALGLRDDGSGTQYRNHFVSGPGCDHYTLCMQHVVDGLMARRGPSELFGGGDFFCFVVTDAGKAHVDAHRAAPPKLTRSQRRYRDWLRS